MSINDPKLNSIRLALLAGDFATVFFIAPQGILPAWDSSPENKINFDYWNGNNPTGKPLSIGELRVNDAGIKVPFTESELNNYFRNYQKTKPGWECSEEQINKWTKRVLAGNGKYLFPSQIFCKQPKSSKRKKKLKKVLKVAAAVGVGVAGAVFLGPAISGAAGKAGSVLGVGAGTIAENTGTLVARLNDARTIKAIIDGKMPPPPIELSGQGFRDWAMTTAQDELMQKYQRKLTRDEENQLRAEIAAMQSQLIKTTPANQRYKSSPELAPPLKRIQAIDKQKKSELDKLLLPAIALIGFLLL